jgi:RNA-binding protein
MPRRPDDRQLRAIGHRLKPIVSVGGAGPSDAVISELDRALKDHELVKIKIAVGDRDARDAIIGELLKACHAELIQRIGNTALILRQAEQPDPRKSNLLRPAG